MIECVGERRADAARDGADGGELRGVAGELVCGLADVGDEPADDRVTTGDGLS